MSGSFRTDYHIDFTGSTTGTADLSSGSVQLIIWMTRRHLAEDNATTRAMSGGRMPRNTKSLLMANERGILEACLDPGRMDFCTSASGVARWRNVRWDRDSGIDSEELSPSLPTRSFKLCRCRID